MARARGTTVDRSDRAPRRRPPLRGAGDAGGVSSPPPEAPGPAAPTVTIETRPVTTGVLRLAPGLHMVEIVAPPAQPMPDGGAPAIWLTHVPTDPSNSVDVLSARAAGDQWLRGPRSIVAVRVPVAGGLLMASALGSPSGTPPPGLSVRPVDRLAPPADPARDSPHPEAAEPGADREIQIEVRAHIERLGDRVFAGATWVGDPGEKRRLEGFSIRPLQALQPGEVEYKALHPGGIETPWIPGPQFCGTRAQSLPLTGLAVRIAPHLQDRFSVIYQAAFFNSGVVGPHRNGTPCLPPRPGDALSAINIRIVERRPG